jgi:hypothetical protein
MFTKIASTIMVVIVIVSIGKLCLEIWDNSYSVRQARATTLVLQDHGCKVYRFYEKGDYHYFSRCEDTCPAGDIMSKPGKRESRVRVHGTATVKM